ncbi:hypothetical protein TNCT_102041 [Trichonephila clavata]|uniref:Uncharacterized protein n=1 Tax=Trichonephila clavata TaxID=2740835 RepID=A0A8X6LG20_TRICU|nr:hypothetical protein TNCT_102041 [Trichonephila clavata]
MRKKERGPTDIVFDDKMFFVRGNDNSNVTLATHLSTLEPFLDGERRVRGHKDKTNVKVPNLKNSYNKHREFLDNHDWFTGFHSIVISGNTWYW